jgi:hypothetical protein
MKIIIAAATFVALLAAHSAAEAGNIVNKDAQQYKIDLMCGGATTHTAIPGNATQEDNLETGCTVKLINKNGKPKASINLRRGGDVIIQKGRLSEA